MVADKFVPSERRNDSAIMSAPTQVGGSGDGDAEIGAALSSGESGPDCIVKRCEINGLETQNGDVIKRY
jgi:hypothetical protein